MPPMEQSPLLLTITPNPNHSSGHGKKILRDSDHLSDRGENDYNYLIVVQTGAVPDQAMGDDSHLYSEFRSVRRFPDFLKKISERLF